MSWDPSAPAFFAGLSLKGCCKSGRSSKLPLLWLTRCVRMFSRVVGGRDMVAVSPLPLYASWNVLQTREWLLHRRNRVAIPDGTGQRKSDIQYISEIHAPVNHNLPKSCRTAICPKRDSPEIGRLRPRDPLPLDFSVVTIRSAKPPVIEATPWPLESSQAKT